MDILILIMSFRSRHSSPVSSLDGLSSLTTVDLHTVHLQLETLYVWVYIYIYLYVYIYIYIYICIYIFIYIHIYIVYVGIHIGKATMHGWRCWWW